MRLGDLDRLYDCIEARYRQSSGDEHKCERALLDAICEMPTIDAIPVEWLKKLTHHNDSHTRASAKWVLGCWKRE